MKTASTLSGFSLVEVLVALAVLSIGMLGVAALQINGVRANTGAYLRGQAVMIATDMSERMYANRTGTQQFQYDGFAFATGNACPVSASICSVQIGNTGTPAACTPAQMAAYDRYVVACGMSNGGGDLLGGVDDLLPNGAVTITCPVAPETVCTAGASRRVTVSWQERVETSTGTAELATQTVGITIRP